MKYASWMSRLKAFSIDAVIWIVIVFVPIFIMRWEWEVDTEYGGITEGGLWAVLSLWLYPSIFESSKWQGTPGKIIQKIKVTTINGKKMHFVVATARFLIKYLSVTFFGIGLLPFFYTKRKQTFYDLATGTVVICDKYE